MTDAQPRPLVAGNWKMNGVRASAEVLERIVGGASPELTSRLDLLVCPPATLIAAFAELARGNSVAIGGQDCHPEPAGAHTGDLSAEMLADAGARFVIVGHSERRTDHGESDGLVRAKAAAALRAGLTPIICVGETRAQRDGGRALDVVLGQVRASLPGEGSAGPVVIAYEPVWAIGTGLVPTTDDVREMHGAIRRELGALAGGETARQARLLYGGSVKPSNARELLSVEDVNGALVGGASLVAADFLAIARAYLPA